jgi:hypothetical protein
MQVHHLPEGCEDIRLGRLTETTEHTLGISRFVCCGQDAHSLGFSAPRRLPGVYHPCGDWAQLCKWSIKVEQDLRCKSLGFGKSCGSGCRDANVGEA